MQDDIYTDNPSENELNFRYNRKERIENAPDNVKKYYSGDFPTPPKGFFKALVHTKSSRYTFMALILVIALFIAFFFFGPKLNQNFLENTSFDLSSFSFEEKIYISIKTQTKTINNETIQIPIKITFSGLDENNQIIKQEEIDTVITQNEEFFRTIFADYDIIKIDAQITNLDTEKNILLTSFVEKK